jgi:uncharacterized protein DUF955
MAIRSDKLRRGFKKEAEAISREVRTEMGASLVDPMDPFALAAHLEIPVMPLSASPLVEVVRHFRGRARRRFSALTVFTTATQRVIVFNDYNSRARQRSDLAHECGHALLLHDPRPAFSSGGCRDVDSECEQEANWLGATLLVPYEAAMAVARSNVPLDEAASRYGVSSDLMRWRINKTGVLRRVAALRDIRRSDVR